MGGTGGNLVDVMGDHDRGNGRGRHDLQRADQLLATAEIKAGSGLIEKDDRGIAHESSREQHSLALTARQRSEASMGERAYPETFEQLDGAASVAIGVRMPPRFQRTMKRSDDDLGGGELRSKRVSEAGGHPADGSPRAADVDATEHRVEHPYGPRGWVLTEGRDAKERGFAAAVRSKHHPVLVGPHYEIDIGDDGSVVAHHVDVAQLDDRSGAHAATLPRRVNPERGKVVTVSDAERIEKEFEAVTGFVSTGSTPLAGGASRVTWEVRAGGDRFVVQAARGDTARDMLGEFELLQVLAREGLPVPEPIAAGSPDGRAILVSARVAGETLGGRVLRALDESGRAALARDFAKAAADIHRVGTPSVAGLAVAAEPVDQVDAYRDVRLALAPHRPVLALAEWWLRNHPPEAAPTVLCHGDLRLGNLIIEDGTLRAVIDWELAHLGHPAEDLGWSCVRAWRFGGQGAALGCVDRETLLADYERFGGSPVSADTLRHHEVLGTWKWGLMCLLQAEAHLSGVVNDLEMLAIGRRVVENEYDLLRLLGWRPDPDVVSERGAEIREMDRPVASSGDGLSGSGTGIVPTIGALKDALVGESEGESSEYRRRLQRSVSEMIAREASVAPRVSTRRVERLVELGVPDHGRLAEELSSGERVADARLLDLLGDEVLDQILVVNPGYIGRVDDIA